MKMSTHTALKSKRQQLCRELDQCIAEQLSYLMACPDGTSLMTVMEQPEFQKLLDREDQINLAIERTDGVENCQ